MGEVQEKKPNGCVEGMKGFCRFLYNPDDHTVFGRSGGSWAKIILFYLVFYGCLAGFFAICLHVMLMTVDPNVPTITGRTNKPVLAISDSRLYKMNFKSSKEWEKYKLGVDAIKSKYTANVAGDNATADFFEWNTANLGTCGGDPGYWAVNNVTKTGCFFVALNRIYGWEPESDKGKLAYDCAFDAGPAGSGNIDPKAVKMTVFPAPADQDLNKFYPWTSIVGNGLQPVVSIYIEIDSAIAAETEKKDLETHIKCTPYYYDTNATLTALPDSSAAKYELHYEGKAEE